MLDALEILFTQKDVLGMVSASVTGTISQYTHQPTTAGAPALEQLADIKPAVAGAVRFESPALSIELVLALPKDVFQILYRGFSSAVSDECPPGAEDLAGELLNITFGTLDPQLRAKGMKLKSSFPKSFAGPKINVLVNDLPEKGIVIPLKAAERPFFLLVLPSGSIKQKWGFTP